MAMRWVEDQVRASKGVDAVPLTRLTVEQELLRDVVLSLDTLYANAPDMMVGSVKGYFIGTEVKLRRYLKDRGIRVGDNESHFDAAPPGAG
jgi:hypothetical protein